MGAYKYIKQSFQDSYSERSELLRGRVSEWRKQGSIVRIPGPTNVARARELGYKAKPGVIVARIRTIKGMTKREKAAGGRKPSKSGRFFSYRKSLQAVAEDRAARVYTNSEVLNSYYIGEDGKFRYFEVILLDRAHGSVLADSLYAGIVGSKGRSYRGLTKAGMKHRGMRTKGKGTEGNRPSVRSSHRGVRVV